MSAVKKKTVKELEQLNLELASALSLLLSSTSNREAIMAVENAKAVLKKYNGETNSVES